MFNYLEIGSKLRAQNMSEIGLQHTGVRLNGSHSSPHIDIMMQLVKWG